jgi:hypothetical protein
MDSPSALSCLASLLIRQPTRGNVAWARRVLEAALEYVMWR